jgi:NDP-sugar pyrophosphorylase family protein
MGAKVDMTTSAAILAGGFGTRLRSLVSDRPKVMAEIAGRPFLYYLLDQLADGRVTDVILCTGHRSEQIQAALGASYRSLRITYSRESAPLGTAGALRHALPLLTSESLLVLNGDSICEIDLEDLYAQHLAAGTDGTLALTRVANAARYGNVRLDSRGYLLSFDEKTLGDAPGLINAGVYMLNAHLLQTIPEGVSVSLERQVIPSWLPQGLHGYVANGRFIDIGTPESYASAAAILVGWTRDGGGLVPATESRR